MLVVHISFMLSPFMPRHILDGVYHILRMGFTKSDTRDVITQLNNKHS
jgi:hypothetical protein